MFRRFGVSVGILVFLLFAGTAGYMVIEGWTVIDALYMTVITFTTVGYQEVQPLSTVGRVFNIFLILGGVGAMLYFLTALMSHIVEEEVFHAFVRRRRMRSTLASMRRHYILCGFGRVGREVGRAFAVDFVDSMLEGAHDERLQFSEISITSSSALSGSTIATIVRHPHVEALGLRRADGEMIAAPHRHIVLQPGDSLFVIGVGEAVAGLSGAK